MFILEIKTNKKYLKKKKKKKKSLSDSKFQRTLKSYNSTLVKTMEYFRIPASDL